MKIWDTAGQERFKTLTKTFYKKADGVMIIFDLTDAKTFESVKNWIDSIKENAEEGVPIILLGNKMDLEDDRVIAYD